MLSGKYRGSSFFWLPMACKGEPYDIEIGFLSGLKDRPELLKLLTEDLLRSELEDRRDPLPRLETELESKESSLYLTGS